MARLTDFIKSFFAQGDFITINSAAYNKIGAELYYKDLALKQAVSIISNIISKCEFKVYYYGKANDKSKEYYAWNIAPNKNDNGNSFKAKIVEEMLLNEHALIFEAGEDRYCADDFSIEKDGIKPLIFSNVTVNGGTMQKKYSRKDVMYLKLNNAELTRLIDNVYASYGEVLTLAINNYKLRNGSKWKLKVSTTERAKPNFKEKYSEIVNKQLKAFFEGANAIYPEYEGYILEPIKAEILNDTKSADITALRKDVFDMVAGVLKMPLSIMNGTAISEADRKQLKNECIEPIVKIIETELTKQLFDYEQWAAGCYFEIDLTNIDNLDIAQLAGAAEKLIGSGVMNIDEVRTTIFGLKALGTTQSTKYWITKNFADIEKMSIAGGEENESSLSA